MRSEIELNIPDDYPNDMIYDVISFKLNSLGFYDVLVDIDVGDGDDGYNRMKKIIPYPISEFNKLTENQQLEWSFENGKQR